MNNEEKILELLGQIGSQVTEVGNHVAQLDSRITEVESNLRDGISWMDKTMRAEMAGLSKDLHSDVASVEKGLRVEITTMSKELRGEIATVYTDLSSQMVAVDEGLRGEIAASNRQIMAYIENNVEKKIELLAEGHAQLSDKIDAVQMGVTELQARQDNMELTVMLHDRKLSVAK